MQKKFPITSSLWLSLIHIFLTKHIGELDAKIKEKQSEIDHVLSSKKEKILAAVAKLKKFSKNFDIRRLAAVTGADKKNFYIICFWMTARDAKKFKAEIESDPNVICLDVYKRQGVDEIEIKSEYCRQPSIILYKS